MNTITGKLFVISAPSGAGKSSLLQALLQRCPTLQLAISHTTRAPRPGEQDGVHYHFIAKTTFLDMIERGEFLEYAEVFSNYYGTTEVAVRDVLRRGDNLILEIDWQGAIQVRRHFPDACCIFILPPSLEVLQERLTKRGQDNPVVIEQRMQAAQQELSHYPEYDYLVVNDIFERALDDLHSIVVAQDLQAVRQAPRLASILSALLATV